MKLKNHDDVTILLAKDGIDEDDWQDNGYYLIGYQSPDEPMEYRFFKNVDGNYFNVVIGLNQLVRNGISLDEFVSFAKQEIEEVLEPEPTVH